MVAFPKQHNPNEIRLCVDLRQPNKAVQRHRHPTPTIDKITNELNGACVFCKLDLRSSYHQIELTPESHYLTTFVTHKELRRYTRLLFGLSSASEVFQYVIQQALQGIKGVKNISDDIIVFGCTQEEHDAALANTFQRLREKSLTLNGPKCVYNKKNPAFFGYVFSAKGMSSSKGRCYLGRDTTNDSIGDPKFPRVDWILFAIYSKLRHFDGIPETPHPQRHSMELGHRTERVICCPQRKSDHNHITAYFDPNKHTVATFDASPFCLGAVLTQFDQQGHEHAVAYTSRTLTGVTLKLSMRH